jgi:aminoglycoside phosphotransferase (APT) family kinase protein
MLDPDPLPLITLDWIARSTGQGARVESVRPLDGATSSRLFAVDVSLHGRLLALVLRLFTNCAWLAEEPALAWHEASSLIKVRAIGIPTRELIGFEPAGVECGVPALLMTRLPGSVDLQPADFHSWLVQQAEILLPLHTIDAQDFPWHYAPYVVFAS